MLRRCASPRLQGLPRPARASRAVRGRRPLIGQPRRPGRHRHRRHPPPRRADERRRGPPARHRSRPARSPRSVCSTRSATCSSSGTRRTRRPGRDRRRPWPTSRTGSGRTRPGCSTGSARSSRAAARSPEPPAHRLEELLLTRVANENPALGPLRELVDDRPLADGTRATARRSPGSRRSSPTGRRATIDGPSLIELMRAPARHAPTSLAGQLRFIRERWGGAPRRRRWRTCSAGSTSRSASWPRRSVRSTSGSAAAAGGGARRHGRGAVVRRRRPTSPRRSRRTRPGCRASC